MFYVDPVNLFFEQPVQKTDKPEWFTLLNVSTCYISFS